MLKLSNLRLPVGASKIADILNEQGVDRSAWIASNPSGHKFRTDWDKQVVLRMLRNPIYKGELHVIFQPTNKVSGFDDVVTHKVLRVPSVVDDGLFSKATKRYEQIRLKLTDGMESRTERNWLQGFIACRVCKTRLVGVKASVGITYYKCPNSDAFDPHGMVRASDIEPIVKEALVEKIRELTDFKKVKKYANDSSGEFKHSLKAIKAKMKKEEAKLSRLNEGYLEGLFKPAEFKRLKTKIDEAISGLEEQLEMVEERASMEQDEFSVHRLRKLLDHMVDSEESYKLLRLASQRYLSHVSLGKRPKLKSIQKMDNEEIKEHLVAGYLTAKMVRDALGRTQKWVIAHLGHFPRKKPVDYSVKIVWEN